MIKAMHRLYGLTVGQAAEQLGIERDKLYRMLTNRQRMDAETREALGALLSQRHEALRAAEYQDWLARCAARSRLIGQIKAGR